MFFLDKTKKIFLLVAIMIATLFVFPKAFVKASLEEDAANAQQQIAF